MAGSEPVTSPDQHKPGNPRLARIGGFVTMAVLVLMTIGNHKGWVENVWLYGLAALLGLVMLIDWLLRKNGLKSN